MILDNLKTYWPTFVTIFSVLLSISCSLHAVLKKRDSRAATGWVGIIWLVPVIGSCLYLLLGINRIRRFGKIIRKKFPQLPVQDDPFSCTHLDLKSKFPHMPYLLPLMKLGSSITRRPLLNGNDITPLVNGDEAYPVMLDYIKKAQLSITLSTYIFDNDVVGKKFIEALSDAMKHGVQVRVLIDDIGLRYSWRPVLRTLKRARIPVAQFMGALRPMTFPHINLRKHRKIMVIDGKVAFTGGMNIRKGHQHSLNPSHPINDLHFKIKGPVVSQLQDVFVRDWAFTTKEVLKNGPWFAKSEYAGEALARVITDGPDDDLHKLTMTIEGAISTAEKSIWILTPYFIPDSSLLSALYVASNKGVEVNIVLPSSNNMPFVQWASNPQLFRLLLHGCKVWFTSPPFDHTKLMVVDEFWVLFGSANMDPRSLRLNFELDVECYDAELAKKMMKLIQEKLQLARMMTSADFIERSSIFKIRDGVARLFSPYL